MGSVSQLGLRAPGTSNPVPGPKAATSCSFVHLWRHLVDTFKPTGTL